MPFKSEKQRRWMYANKPALARKWAKNYKDGGYVEPAQSFADGGFVTVRHGDEELTVVLDPLQVIDMEGNDITDTPKGQNALAKAESSYTVEQEAATDARIQRNVEDFGALVGGLPMFAAEMTPILGDAIAVKELYDELQKNPVSWAMVALLGGTLVIGMFPVVGDIIAKGLKTVGKGIIKLAADATPEMRKVFATASKNGMSADDIVKYQRQADETGEAVTICNYASGGVVYANDGSKCVTFKPRGRPSKSRRIVVEDAEGNINVIEGDNAAQAIADATGYALKTVQNKLANNKPIISPDGTIYREAKEGDNLGPVDLLDAREKTLGTIEGFDGTFSDLMREHGIDPRSDKANNIRQRLARGHEWTAPNGEKYRRSDVDDFATRQEKILEAARTRNQGVSLNNMMHRMQNIGLDTSNGEMVKSFFMLWKKKTKSRVKRPNAEALSAARTAASAASNAEYTKLINQARANGVELTDEVVHELLQQSSKAGMSARWNVMKDYYIKRVAKDAKMTEWRQWFLKYAPEKLTTSTAPEQRAEIAVMLTDSYLGQAWNELEKLPVPDEWIEALKKPSKEGLVETGKKAPPMSEERKAQIMAEAEAALIDAGFDLDFE